MTRIDIVIYDGVDTLDAIGPWEVFRKAKKFGAPISVGLVAREPAAVIESSDGLLLTGFGSLEKSDAPWILVPGGAWASRAPRGAWAEIERGDLPRVFRERRAGGTSFASVCTGAMLLAAAGMTRDRAMTTHALAKSALAESGARVLDASVVDDGDLVSSGGVTAGIDLAIWMVERWVSPEAAALVARAIEWQRTPDLHRVEDRSRLSGADRA